MNSFTLVDQYLDGYDGHYARMAEIFLEFGSANEAWGRISCSLKHPRLYRHFKSRRYRFPPIPDPPATMWRKAKHYLECLAVMICTNYAYLRQLCGIARNPSAVWFVPNIQLYDLPALLLFAAIFRQIRIVGYFLNAPSRHLRACGLLARLLKVKNVRFVAEHETMSMRTSSLLSIPVQTILFPILPPGWPQTTSPTNSRPNRPLRLYVLGPPRREKGFHWLPSVAKQLQSELSNGSLKFVIQTLPDYIKWDRLDFELSELRSTHGFEFIESTLNNEQYLLALEKADAVFTPYVQSAYAQRSSRIPVEALALGKPVLLTEGILAGDIVRQYGCGLFFSEGDVEGMVSRIRELIDNYTYFRTEAMRAAASFRTKNSPERFFHDLKAVFDQP